MGACLNLSPTPTILLFCLIWISWWSERRAPSMRTTRSGRMIAAPKHLPPSSCFPREWRPLRLSDTVISAATDTSCLSHSTRIPKVKTCFALLQLCYSFVINWRYHSLRRPNVSVLFPYSWFSCRLRKGVSLSNHSKINLRNSHLGLLLSARSL